MSVIEIILILTGYSFIILILTFSYLRSKISNLRIEKINDYMNARERDFIEKFQNSLQEFRETNINIQHDIMRLDRLRGGIDTTFEILEKKLTEVNQYVQNMDKTSDFYKELQNTFKENNLKLQDFIAKLNVMESEFQNKEAAAKHLEQLLTELEEKFSQNILALETNFSGRLRESEKNIQQEYERMINFSKINKDKLKEQYNDLEAELKDKIDILTKEEREHLQDQIGEIRSNSESELRNLQESLQQQDNQINTLMDRYVTWEKEIADHRQMTQDRIDKFSETVLSGFKEKIDDYQQEVLALLEHKHKKLNHEVQELEKRNRVKQEALDSLMTFVEESKNTITYQINNLSEFLEQQKELHNALYQKNRLVLVDAYKDIRTDIAQIQNEIDTVNQNRQTILAEINNYLDTKLPQAMADKTSDILLELFSPDNNHQAGDTPGSLTQQLENFFNHKVKDTVKANISWMLERMKEDPGWQSFLEEQARLRLVDKLDTEKLQKQYQNLELDFKEMVDRLIKSEEDRFQKELQNFKSDSQQEVVSVQANFQEYQDQFADLIARYNDWEKKIDNQQHDIEERVTRFSEEVVNEIEKKSEKYQQEILGQLEKRFDEIEKYSSEIEKRSHHKQEALDSLTAFVEESKNTITYQINNLSNYIEEQKKAQAENVGKEQASLRLAFEKISEDLKLFQSEVIAIKKNKKLIQEDIKNHVEDRLQQMMSDQAPQILRQVFDTSSHNLPSEHVDFLQEFDQYFSEKLKTSLNNYSSLMIEKLKQDPNWDSFLEKQARIHLFNKVKTEKIFNELKKNFSKEFIRRELQEEIKTYQKGIQGVDKDWKKISQEVLEQKKFLDRIIVQGKDRLEDLVEGIKLNLAEKEQSFQDIFNEMIMGMEKKMTSVTQRIDFFLDKTKSVDKIFQFQKDFTDAMADYKKQLAQLKKTEKRFADFTKNFEKVEEQNQRLQVIHQNLQEKESQAADLAQQLGSIMDMSEQIQKHIETVKSQSDEIDTFISQLQNYNRDIIAIKKEFGDLKKLQDEFQEVKGWVEKTHSQSQSNQEKTDMFLERVAAGEELQKNIFDSIKGLEQKSLSLDDRYKAIEYFNKKFDDFDIAVYDLEKRIETTKALKKEMAVEQENLNLLKEGFNEQISIILKIFQNQRGDDRKLFTELDKKFKSLPETLSHIGWSDKEIAKHLNLELYEVQLLLNRKKRKK